MSSEPLFDFADKQLTIGQILQVEQQENLSRVSKRIAGHVRAFCREALAKGGEFSAEQLRRYVESRVPGAPASSDRILRALRQKGEIGYEVTDRAKSLYRVTQIK